MCFQRIKDCLRSFDDSSEHRSILNSRKKMSQKQEDFKIVIEELKVEQSKK